MYLASALQYTSDAGEGLNEGLEPDKARRRVTSDRFGQGWRTQPRLSHILGRRCGAAFPTSTPHRRIHRVGVISIARLGYFDSWVCKARSLTYLIVRLCTMYLHCLHQPTHALPLARSLFTIPPIPSRQYKHKVNGHMCLVDFVKVGRVRSTGRH